MNIWPARIAMNVTIGQRLFRVVTVNCEPDPLECSVGSPGEEGASGARQAGLRAGSFGGWWAASKIEKDAGKG